VLEPPTNNSCKKSVNGKGQLDEKSYKKSKKKG